MFSQCYHSLLHKFICITLPEKRNHYNMEGDNFPRILWVSGHSKRQSVNIWDGRRNVGRWYQKLPEVRKSRISFNACVFFDGISAHAQKLILRRGKRRKECSSVLTDRS